MIGKKNAVALAASVVLALTGTGVAAANADISWDAISDGDCAVFSTPKLSSGSSGQAVDSAQCLLNQAGSYRLKRTGTYDAKTKAAVTDFQQKVGLEADGVVEGRTWAALQQPRLGVIAQPKKVKSPVVSKETSRPLKSGTYRLGAYWGKRGSWAKYHTGQDFAASSGTPIYAAASGKIISGQAGSWAGTHVVIQHTDGSATLYAHLSSKNVKVGQSVQAGQMIGRVGNTGRSFGSHLHLEYYPKASEAGQVYQTKDPAKWLKSRGVRV